MKTIRNLVPAPTLYAASHKLLAGLLCLGLLSTTPLTFDLEALADIYETCKTQLVATLDWINAGMMQPHQIP